MRLLIVDDEPLTRAGLVNAINWISLGITEIDTAEDGQIALDAVMHNPPNIVLCDLMMPHMNGLDFVKKLRELHSDCKVIFISGYAEKKHLKEFFKLKAMYFIEKPININEFQSIMKATVDQCREEMRARIEIDQMRAQHAIALPLLRKQLAAAIVAGKDSIHAAQSSYAVMYEHIKSAESYCAACLSIRHGKTDGQEGVFRYILSSFRKLQDEGVVYLTDIPGKMDFAIILCGSKVQLTEALRTVSAFFSSLSQTVDGAEYSLGICGPIKDFSNLHNCYEQAACMATWGGYVLPQTIMHDYFHQNFSMQCIPQEKLQSLEEALDSKQVRKACAILDEFEQEMHEQKNGSLFELKHLLESVLLMILRANPFSPYAHAEHTICKSLEQSCNLHDSIEILKAVLRQAFPELSVPVTASAKTRQAAAFIEANYTDAQLSVQMIAQQLSVSTIYLCSLYKKEMGMTIGQSLKELRINKAKLLLETQAKIYEIAFDVGFSDPNYFCTVFKRETGISPQAYRNSLFNPEEGTR